MNLDIAGFALLATVLTISPGQDTFLVLRNASLGGFGAGISTTAGVCSGLFLHATLSALGLSAVVLNSSAAFSALKLLGAAYLIWIGLQSLARVQRPPQFFPTAAGAPREISTGTAARQGFLSNALNPKTAAFYLALLPQFAVFPDSLLIDSIGLAAVHFAISFVWLSFLSAIVHRSRNLLRRPRLTRALHFVAGAAFLGFGLRLALARR